LSDEEEFIIRDKIGNIAIARINKDNVVIIVESWKHVAVEVRKRKENEWFKWIEESDNQA